MQASSSVQCAETCTRSREAKKLADDFAISFDKSHFPLGSPVVDYRASRLLKNLDFKSMSSAEKSLKVMQAKSSAGLEDSPNFDQYEYES